MIGASDRNQPGLVFGESHIGHVARVAHVLAELGALLQARIPQQLDQAEVVGRGNAAMLETGVRCINVRLVCILFPNSDHFVAQHARERAPLDLFNLDRIRELTTGLRK